MVMIALDEDDKGREVPRDDGLMQKKALPHLATEIVKRPDCASGFEVLPRRWVVERTFAWLGRCRRLAKDLLPSPMPRLISRPLAV
jgi:hypothetical protein